MTNWATGKFEDVFALPLRNGLTKPKRVRGAGIRMVNMGEIFANDRIFELEMESVPLNEKEKDNSLLEHGDLLFARQSLTLEGAGKVSVFLGDYPCTFESHLIRARIDKNKCDPLFAYYYFRSPRGRQLVSSIVEQVAAAGIRGSDLSKLPFSYPPMPQQRVIVRILA